MAISALQWVRMGRSLTGNFETQVNSHKCSLKQLYINDAIQKVLTVQMVASNFNSFYF